MNGIAGSPKAMAQSALGFGLFSFVIDYMGNKAAPPATAAVLSSSPSSSPCAYTARSCRQQRQVIRVALL